ncbi:MAG: flippase [Candidatus Aminicenantes bacterium]|nr:flippase [Candidatus Aminicenantes bacterium]
MEGQVEIKENRLAVNTILNFIGQIAPLILGVVTIPFIIRNLGPERFGLLSLAWVILGYFAIFDLGLGRATTKYVADALSQGKKNQVPSLVWTSATVQIVFGLVGSFVFIGFTPLFVNHFLKIPQELAGEAKITFSLLAFAIPVVLITGSFRGSLEAAQRFDLVNAVNIPSHSLNFLLPLIGLWVGFDLPGIIVLVLLSKIGALIAFVGINFHINPLLKRYSGSFSLFPRLFSFGSWVMVSGIVGPILMYLDRFLIGSISGVASVAYYTAPYEIVSRLWIIPTSLVMTLFPAFSSLEGIKDRKKLGNLFIYSVKYILLIMGPIIIIILIFAQEAVQLWLGPDFALKSTTVLQILAAGVLVNSLAFTPFSLLQSIGRPDLPAKFHLLELPIYCGLAYILISKYGIKGAAISWTLRVIIDAFLLFIASFKICHFPINLLKTSKLVFNSFFLLLLAIIAFGLKILTENFPLLIQLILIIALFSQFAWLLYRKEIRALIQKTNI